MSSWASFSSVSPHSFSIFLFGHHQSHRQSNAIETHTRIMRTEENSMARSIIKDDPPCVCACVPGKCKSKGPLTRVTHPRRESSPNTAAPSTKHCARIVSGSFFWKHREVIYYRACLRWVQDHALCCDEPSLVTAYHCDCMTDGWILSTHRRWLDRSLLNISPLLTLQAGSQLLVSAVCHLFDQVQTLLHLEEHTHTHQKCPSIVAHAPHVLPWIQRCCCLCSSGLKSTSCIHYWKIFRNLICGCLQ